MTAEESLRKPRADAQRNRERILAVAKEAFARSGAEPSMDEVARLAEVGPGTLYRNFPSRDALIEALYRVEVEKLAASARELSARLKPGDALREWLWLLVDYMGAKRLYMPALQTMVCGTADVFAVSGAALSGAIELLGTRAIAAGVIRADVAPMDLMLALFGVAYGGPKEDWQERARRMVHVLLVGAKP
ncbi:TetR/AcrR family transcriptional regulator [Silvibacterium dinghuense]|uniref:TetR/AcrR family transcriptional regulator n=2 Tax=Silvibacterium dinghuense TaxID=1560006 RepID=A0A4Q1SB60_9BACT|nr:TetR/AcrR family transcriptional regulator [Silvibacterium dinghuense]GGH06967.1 TetR family transcriptional regulator [Silvibacterium dinghuense]